MIISSVFTLKGDNVITPDNLVEVSTTKIEENYYTNTSLKFLLEMENELISHKQEFYKTLLETDNPYIINESFNDILSKAKEIIKKILAYIESIIKRFITQIAKLIGSDKYLSKMKDSIRKFSNDDAFDIDGYEFTISDTVPITDIIGLDLSELRDELKTVDDSDINTKMAKLSGIIAGLSDEGKIDDIRGQILGLTNPITEADYTNRIFTVFRDGRSDSFTLRIDREYVLKSLDGYFNYKSKQKDVKALQTRIFSKYKSLENQINDIVRSNMRIDGDSTIDVNMNSEKYSTNYKTNLKILLDNMINAQVNQIQRIANLHVQAIAGKLDAYNALIIQDRNILYRALQKVQKDIKNSKLMESFDLDPDVTNYDYTLEATGKGYVKELYYLKLRHHRFIQECMCISESNIEGLNSITEDLKMDTKNKFQKLVEFLKQIYQKFLMKMNKFIMNDEKFLSKYKDVILNKRTEEYTLNNMPDYQAGIKNIVAHKVKSLDVKSLLDKDEDYIKKQLLPEYKGGDTEYAEFAKKYFLHNNQNPIPSETKSSSLNMKDLYDFCVGAKATVKVLEQDLKSFETETNKIKTEVLKAANNNTTTTKPANESAIDRLLRGYITEEEQKDKSVTISNDNKAKENTKSDAKTDNKESNTNLDLSPTKPDHNNSEQNKDLDKQVKNDTNGDDAEKQAQENKNAEAKKVEETADWYLSALRTVCTAKITAFQRIYSEYMKILRYHVKLATGDMGSSSNLKSEDIEEIQKAMIDYYQNNNKESATQKLKDIYKSRGMVLDDHAVQNLVNKNKAKIEELIRNNKG